ncbi:MAG: hypothetical protein V4606_01980 [Patescibacteria group bacterium]
MNKTLLIIAGVSAILLLVAIWLYLLIYGTPKPIEQFFTDFSFAENSDITPLTPFIPEVTNGQVDVDDLVQLRQLTLKPTIGFGEKISITNNEQLMLYAEAGTGHVFSIDLVTGTEIRLSNITITNPQLAKFSPNGEYVAIRSGYGAQNTVELLTLAGENSATKVTLIPKMVDFNFNDNNQLLYSEFSSVGLTGKELNPTTKTIRTLFSVPFQSATFIWSMTTTTPHYVYPKASAKLTGFLYSFVGGTVNRLPIEGRGLTSFANSDYVIFSKQTGNGPASQAYSVDKKTSSTLASTIDPNKCAFSKTELNIFYCGSTQETYGSEFPDDWYKGIRSYSDQLWRIDASKGSASQLINPESVVGRAIDVTTMQTSSDGGVLYFTNKTDNTLWMYEI